MSAFPNEDREPDWNLAKALYLGNLPLSEIVSQAHVSDFALRKRIVREGWNKLRTDAATVVSSVVVTKSSPTEGMTKEQGDKLTEHSNLARQALSSEVSCLVGQIVAIKQPKSLKAILERFNVLKVATDVAKTVYGWSDTHTTTAVDIRLLQSAESRPMHPVQPAIDVAQVPEPQAIEDKPGAIQER